MYCSNLSYLVGSAQDKLANDMKRVDKKVIISSSHMNKLKSNEEKSSCKKKFIFKSISKDDLSKTLNLKVVKWSIRLSLFIIFGTLFSLSIYKVVVFQRTCCNNSTSIRTRSMYPRSHFINTPVIYEIEPITFFDSNYDGIGDLNGIIQRLDYIQNNLFVNCIIIKNIQNSFSFKYYNLQLVKMNLIDEKIGTIEDLKNLVTEAHKRSIKVILELQLASTSIDHDWFTNEVINLRYVTRKTKPESMNEIKSWIYNQKNNFYYFNNAIDNYAYLNYDNYEVQTSVIECLKYWFDQKLADGIYIKDFNEIVYTNITIYKNFLNQLKQLSLDTQIRLIVDYSNNTNVEIDRTLHEVIDSYRVYLNSNEILMKIIANVNPFEEYFIDNNRKPKLNYMWSFKSFDMPPYQYDQRRYLMIAIYTIMYSLPGGVVIRQSDELEYTNRPQSPQVFRWNDLEAHSGFSLTTQLSLWWFPMRINRIPILEDGFDLHLVNSNKYSLFNILKNLNQNVKYRLNSERFNFNLTKSMFKMYRYVSYYSTSNNYKLIVFLLNFSRNEFELLKYLVNSNVFSQNNQKLQKLISVYDSTNVNDYYDDITNMTTSYTIKPNHYLILELELTDLIS